VVGACLHHGDVVVGAELQQRLGDADMVVEVALRIEHTETLSEDGGDEFLRRRLTVGTGNLQNGAAELTAVVSRQLLERLQHVVDVYQARVARHRGIVDDGIGTAGGQSLQSKGIAVEGSAAQGKEERPRGTITRVGGDDGVRKENLVERGESHIVNYLVLTLGNTVATPVLRHMTPSHRCTTPYLHSVTPDKNGGGVPRILTPATPSREGSL